MDLAEIVKKTTEGLFAVDSITKTVKSNRRTHETYLPGVKTIGEVQFIKELFDWWDKTFPEDFQNKSDYVLHYPYDTLKGHCDVVFNTNNSKRTENYEWAIEYKYIGLVGNNGKNNDYGLAKALSPYLKDRSLIHDVERLRESKFAQEKAVILYGFEYDFNTCAIAEKKCFQQGITPTIVQEVKKVCESVDPVNGTYSLEPIVEMLDDFLSRKNWVKGSGIHCLFDGAYRHPAGGKGRVVGWEIISK